MDIVVDIRPKTTDITLVVLSGEIGTETVDRFKDSLDEIIASGKTKLILDFQGVVYLNSMGLGVMTAALKKVKKKKGDLKLVNLSPAVHELFELTRFSKVFDIFDSEDMAMKSFM